MIDDGAHRVELPSGPFDLRTELARMYAMRDEVMPGDVGERMDRATAELVASRLTDGVPGVGQLAPSFILPDATGRLVSLDRLLAEGPVVISFYRGIWCPFCSLELRALQQALPEITGSGGRLVAISQQTPDSSLTTVERHDLTFDVLSDVDGAVSRAYGLEFRLPDDLQEVYSMLGHPLPAFNGTDRHTLPVPATFVVDIERTVRFAFADPDYARRADPADVVAALHALG
jgi:peroxiredoxin